MIYTELTKKAMKLAYDAHNGQTDKSGYAGKTAKSFLVLIKIMHKNLCTNPIGTSSEI